MFWKETQNNCIPHMMMTLRGIFKKKKLGWHCVPLADQTKSGVPTRRWISWILYRQSELDKQKTSFLFTRDNGSKAIIGNYDKMLIN